ncbi:phosphatase PAP2 family protein [Flavobacterium microcysteis]|uniref:Phosphatase PAP2 family protein n=1 Tax=Flavobacterium microcysteis TaxID=2596891 RepID=A0A501QKP6_9FLAO|nr:phosphatase PAP2 family protein [Flavobacterium microcysteis]TPD73390.1 phosphatase PAP2 family protein [Flavobacterium microcysteis]
MNTNVIINYARLKLPLFLLPIFLLVVVVLFLYSQNALCVEGYVQIQKDSFFFINQYLGQYPYLQINLTQLGDALVILSLLSIFFIYASKVWESLLSGSLVSLLLAGLLKKIFAIPRPAAVFSDDSFIIIGKKLTGHNSLPSGHSITVFTVLTVLLFSFMPKSLKSKIAWYLAIIAAGLVLVFTRVGVGAHYPLDVIVGSIVGYISGLAGIFISRKYRLWGWICNKKYCPVFILLFLICCILLTFRIINQNLVLFYLATASLIVSLYKIITIYVKK